MRQAGLKMSQAQEPLFLGIGVFHPPGTWMCDQPPSWSCLGAHQELSHQHKLRDGQKELIMYNEDAPISQDFPRVLGAQGQEMMTKTKSTSFYCTRVPYSIHLLE